VENDTDTDSYESAREIANKLIKKRKLDTRDTNKKSVEKVNFQEKRRSKRLDNMNKQKNNQIEKRSESNKQQKEDKEDETEQDIDIDKGENDN